MGMAGMFGQQDVPGAEMMMEMMFGEGETMSVYMAVADENTIIGSYVSKENLVKALASFDQGDKQLADMPAVASTVAGLDKDAQFIGLWSPQGDARIRVASRVRHRPTSRSRDPSTGRNIADWLFG